jgi:TPR repeat protein
MKQDIFGLLIIILITSIPTHVHAEAAQSHQYHEVWNMDQIIHDAKSGNAEAQVKIEQIRDLAAKGDATAQDIIGTYYYAKQDYPEAMKWFLKAAEQGNAAAQSKIGGYYMLGTGVNTDYKEAMKWSRKAAKQGDVLAKFSIGVMYYNGYGVRQDYSEAFKWLHEPAEQGNSLAQQTIGAMYYNGQGVRQDKAQAKEWFGKACDNGLQSGCDGYRRLNEAGY